MLDTTTDMADAGSDVAPTLWRQDIIAAKQLEPRKPLHEIAAAINALDTHVASARLKMAMLLREVEQRIDGLDADKSEYSNFRSWAKSNLTIGWHEVRVLLRIAYEDDPVAAMAEHRRKVREAVKRNADLAKSVSLEKMIKKLGRAYPEMKQPEQFKYAKQALRVLNLTPIEIIAKEKGISVYELEQRIATPLANPITNEKEWTVRRDRLRCGATVIESAIVAAILGASQPEAQVVLSYITPF